MKMNYVKNAVLSRIRGWESAHFEKTRYGRALAAMKDSHQGERCFVIGNGPSLTAADLQKLHDNNIPCFGTNRVFKIFDQTDWHPRFYVSEDILLLRDVQKEVENLPSEKKFVPINLKWFEDVWLKSANYFYMDYSSELADSFGLSLNIPHGIRCCGTVTISCLQIAIYMGFSEIYLLGVDHSFAKMFDKNGNVVIDSSIRNHFTDDYDKGVFDQGFHIDAATEAYCNVEQLSRKMGTFRVFNATRGGKLEVFERADFDEIIGREKR